MLLRSSPTPNLPIWKGWMLGGGLAGPDMVNYCMVCYVIVLSVFVFGMVLYKLAGPSMVETICLLYWHMSLLLNTQC